MFVKAISSLSGVLTQHLLYFLRTHSRAMFCAPEISAVVSIFFATRSRFEGTLEYELKKLTEITGFNILSIQIIYAIYYGNYLKIF